MLQKYLEGLKSRDLFRDADSFYDINWRLKSNRVVLKSSLTNIPREFSEGCVVSSDALHFLNVFRQFGKQATIAEFFKVLEKLKSGWDDEYSRSHIEMYADSFVAMRIFEVEVKQEPILSSRDSRVAFIPVFGGEDKSFKFILESVKEYEVVEKEVTPTDKYISLSVFEGQRASQGVGQGDEPSMTSYGF
jgi:hypothetical protein